MNLKEIYKKVSQAKTEKKVIIINFRDHELEYANIDWTVIDLARK